MTENRALALVTNADPDTGWWLKTKEQAAIFVKTGFLPDAIKTAEQAIMVMLKGYELGLPRTYALSNIAIVKGKPTISAEAMLALVSRDYGKQAFRVKASTNTACTVEWRLDGWQGTTDYTFTIEDAQTAGLAQSDTWRKYPAAMLRARAISAGIRMSYPECIAGMYSPGELGEEVVVTDDGVVLSASMILDADAAGALPAPERDTRSQADKSAVTLFHETLAARGYNDPDDRAVLHGAAHRIARFHFPEITSLTQLTEQMMRDLTKTVADASDGDLALWATDWELEITQAESMEQLIAIAQDFPKIGITKHSHPDLAEAWKRRSTELITHEAA